MNPEQPPRRLAIAKQPEPTMLDRYYQQQAELVDALVELGADYQLDKCMFKFDGSLVGPDMMARQIKSLAAKGSLLARAGAVDSAILAHINLKHMELAEKAKAFLSVYDAPRGIAEVRKFVAMMRDVPDAAASDEDMAAVMSMLWQIKRKVNGHYQLNYPLMLIFTGGQEYGKTRALQLLFEPVEHIKAGGMKLQDFNNGFNLIAFSRYYIVPFQEMNSKVPYDVELFKNLVTEGDYQYRDPGTKNTAKLPNVATLYGTSNHRVAHSIPDSTGARRWWEIESPNRAFGDADKARVAAIDFKLIWASVDGTSDVNPREPYRAKMKVQQEKLRHKSDLDTAWTDLVTETRNEGDKATDEEVYQTFKAWYNQQDLRSPKKGAVREYFMSRGFAKPSGGVWIYTGFRFKRV